MVPLFFLLATAVLGIEPSLNMVYYGFRVVKNCKSLMRDNEDLMKEIEFTGMPIDSISESQGGWWNSLTLTLKDFKVTKHGDLSTLKATTCSVLNTGAVQAFNDKEPFTIDLSFAWELKQFNVESEKGTASVRLESKQIDFMQNYYHSRPSTVVNLHWKNPVAKFDSSASEMVASWCNKLLGEKLVMLVNLGINNKLKPVNKEIIKHYEILRIPVEAAEKPVIANNWVSNPRGVTSNNEFFSVLNFQTSFNNTKYTHTINAPLDLPVPTFEKAFDYAHCFSSRFFSGYVAFRSLFQQLEETFLNAIKPGAYPTRIGYYKSIIPNLANRYTDDKEVAIDFRGSTLKKVTHLSEGRFKVPTTSKFAVKGETKPFLVFDAEYEVKYEVIVENNAVKGNLTEARLRYLEVFPEVDYQAQLISTELANNLGDLIRGYVIGKDTGLTVKNWREKDYAFVDKKVTKDEVCLLYSDSGKSSHE
eukprot:TRINITY_DN10762_c0_g1_i1.p1 TRINITY_DN10762_c0_g1~~TRINITY_DN10762_c0_g1_i1.p1  ORF type:complete len:475 (+),score=130.51 TRINITY_DN10762_c0_g1_i1:220-1644(+)